MRKRQFFMDGANVDDLFRTPRLAEVTHDGLRHKEHALEVDIENGVEIFFGDVPEVRRFLETGIVHKNVDPAESRDALIDKSLSIRDFADVRLKSHRASLGCRNDSR